MDKVLSKIQLYSYKLPRPLFPLVGNKIMDFRWKYTYQHEDAIRNEVIM